MAWAGGAGAVSTQMDPTARTAAIRRRRSDALAILVFPSLLVTRRSYVRLAWSMVAVTRYQIFDRKRAVERILVPRSNQARTPLLVTRRLADSPPLPRT